MRLCYIIEVRSTGTHQIIVLPVPALEGIEYINNVKVKCKQCHLDAVIMLESQIFASLNGEVREPPACVSPVVCGMGFLAFLTRAKLFYLSDSGRGGTCNLVARTCDAVERDQGCPQKGGTLVPLCHQ